ncbi:acyl-CoA thioesterase [Fictibacillus sp. KIGAM418]|uniref:Acyl-CoA thioesterase n=1 Tax=Fictibacillus marinisediminis TaxID=2878389 RepID=A0A9X1XAI7_9BACL|nr:thioesterase family protein [Fictibacillus marinisediminis]MCK6257136.1 acyl-CoA thioesterase [Fictibacillus marinisediminis]
MLVSEAKVDVRYAETDQMGVVYHANYLVWFEIGRTAFIKDLGFSYAQMEKDGILSPVTEIHANYKKPLTYGDQAKIFTWVDEYTGLKVKYGYEIRNSKDELCVTGNSTHVCVKKDSFRPISIKKVFPDWHQAYEGQKKQKQG